MSSLCVSYHVPMYYSNCPNACLLLHHMPSPRWRCRRFANVRRFFTTCVPAVAKSILPPLAEDLISTVIDPYYKRDYSREGKARENDFRKIFTSTGKESTCASMPAPTTGMDTGMDGIEAFGGGEEAQAEGKSNRK